jgi:hypothetical protein
MAAMIRCVLLSGFVAALALAAGLYVGIRQAWPAPQLKRLADSWVHPSIRTDPFGRLLRYPGKIEIVCPAQDKSTAVLLLIGQSNAANYQGQRYESPDDRVVNFSEGHCFRAASPLLGADGRLGETWTLLGNRLVQGGLFRTVILIPAAVGGSNVHRWAAGGDMNAMMVSVMRAAKPRYGITGVLLDQGATDSALRTSEERYRSDLQSLIQTVRDEGVAAPFFITRCSFGGRNWLPDNPVARAQASLADSRKSIFDGPNTDRDVTPLDRYDDYHFGASGQQKYDEAWLTLLQAHPGIRPNG